MSSTLTLAEVETISRRMLIASGASPLQADATARSITDAEAESIRTVGLSYLPTYCDHVTCGKVNGNAVPVVSSPRPGTIVVDAGLGFCRPAYEAGEAALIAAAQLTVLPCSRLFTRIRPEYLAGLSIALRARG